MSADIYPVGVLATIQIVGRAMASRSERFRGRRLEVARRAARIQWRSLTSNVRDRNWRALQNSFNGYLAEHDNHPHDCGTGWTKRRANRRAERLCREVTP